MKIYKPVSGIMTTKVITVTPSAPLTQLRRIFKENSFHHIPVCVRGRLVGIISKTDFLHVTHGVSLHGNVAEANEEIYRKIKARDIMTRGIAKISPNDHIAVAMELFLENLFHCIPIVEDGDKKLKGIVTTFDIIKYGMESEERMSIAS